MNVKNYTSEVPASRSMARIEEVLVEIGASNITKTYVDKECTGLTFLYTDPGMAQTLAFHLKAQTEECYKILAAKVKRPRRGTEQTLRSQANRTAWKILSDWTEIQCSMILLGQAAPLQMFLPFVYDVAKRETLYDKIQSGKIQLQLPKP